MEVIITLLHIFFDSDESQPAVPTHSFTPSAVAAVTYLVAKNKGKPSANPASAQARGGYSGGSDAVRLPLPLL